MQLIPHRSAAWPLAIVAVALVGLGTRADGLSVQASPAVAPGRFVGDLRTLPLAATAQPDEVEAEDGPERRITHPEAMLRVPVWQERRDPLLELQARARRRGVMRVYEPPELNFDAQVFSSVRPPDTVGDIGSDYYIQAINRFQGTTITIYDKTSGAIAAGPFILAEWLWTAGGDCATGAGDPIVLYDSLASRWLISEFADSGNHLCIYLSMSNDPISGGWLNYDFVTPDFPDYPKYAVWPDAYYVTTNESEPAAYALDRINMLAGAPATAQRFTASVLDGFSFQALIPADLDGSTAPPGGSTAFFLRHKDDEVHPPAVPGSDQLEVWEMHVDFATPASSTFALATSIPVTEFESELCGTTSFNCIPQPGTTQLLDPLREVVMWRAQYRNFGAYQTIVGNFVTDIDGGAADHAGIRWFELRRSGLGAWSLFQEGTYGPDAEHRWMGSVAMDGGGNMALGFSISGSLFPSIRYTGRLAGDAAGAMTQPEVNAASGASFQASERWGDYASMNVDPINDCTFWFTTEDVLASGLWQTRITRLRYDAPTCVDAAAPVCGNNTKEVGEDCDGSDSPYCPGLCTGSCTCPAPICGNDVVEVGELCDGASLGLCTVGCTPSCVCNLCDTTPEPALNCLLQAEPARASIFIADKSDAARDRIKWSWNKGEATATAFFGYPTTANGARYELCVYDASASTQPLLSASIPPGGTCGSRDCWSETSKGYKYRDKVGSNEGITSINLRSGFQGESTVKVQGKGASLTPPDPMLTLPVTVQLLSFDGTTTRCWQTTYTTSIRNDDEIFKAKGP